MYPKYKNFLELVKKLPNERSCHQYLAAQRWGGLMECPHEGCKGEKAYAFKDGIRYKCATCRKIYTAKTNTFMAASKLPTIKWLAAMHYVLHKKGVSSKDLHRDLGVSPVTAWFMLQRIRFAFGNDIHATQPLEGVVQLDETYVGGKNINRHHDKKIRTPEGNTRTFIDKTPVMGMLQQEESEIVERPHKIIPGRIVKEKVVIKKSVLKCMKIPNTQSKTLKPLVYKHIKPGSTIISDEWRAYHGLSVSFNHQIVDHSRKQYVNKDGFSTNGVESHWSQLKKGIKGVYHHVSRKHLDKYVQEFVFKHNYRNLDFQGQIEQIICNMNCRLKYKDLIAA